MTQDNANALDLICPMCRTGHALDIMAHVRLRLTQDGSDATDSDHEFGDADRFECANCDHSGIVRDLVQEVQGTGLERDELDAICNYAAEHGRHWRRQLRADWMNGRTSRILQRLRNGPGPDWLNRFRLQA